MGLIGNALFSRFEALSELASDFGYEEIMRRAALNIACISWPNSLVIKRYCLGSKKRSIWLDKIAALWRKRRIVWLSGVRRVGKTRLCQQISTLFGV